MSLMLQLCAGQSCLLPRYVWFEPPVWMGRGRKQGHTLLTGEKRTQTSTREEAAAGEATQAGGLQATPAPRRLP